MPTFTDKNGREWAVEITLDLIPELRACGLDLAKLAAEREGAARDGAVLDAVLVDPERFGQILWVVCGEQAEKAGLDPRAFARSFTADTLAAATDALLLAVYAVTFRRAALRQLAEEELPKLWAKAEAEAREALATPPAPPVVAAAATVEPTGYAG